MRHADFPYLPKDYIQTKEGLIFAVVSYQAHQGKVGCFLRYIPDGKAWKKVDTEQANRVLQHSYPQYCYQSVQFDTAFHAVDVDDIVDHHRPEQALKAVLQGSSGDEIEEKVHQLLPVLIRFGAVGDALGLTGSLLIGQHNAKSDIDLVVYGREAFHKTRQAVKRAVAVGELEALSEGLMTDNFERRGCELGFDEFSWHEHRKFNKAAIGGCKFDIGMVCLAEEVEYDYADYQKKGSRTIITTVVDAHRAFDFPAFYGVDDKETAEVVSFTHTYVGQAKLGEKIEVSGAVEKNNATGKCRLIVGATREAKGEYIKVCR